MAPSGIHAIAWDTDDGAGTLLDPGSFTRATGLGIDVRARLADNDGDGVFAALGDLVVTESTRTNVNNLRAVLVRAPA